MARLPYGKEFPYKGKQWYKPNIWRSFSIFKQQILSLLLKTFVNLISPLSYEPLSNKPPSRVPEINKPSGGAI